MSYVIGFDLGTHQTKICVQDATNPAEKTYEFFKFHMPDGVSSFLFPSIVQINKDHTLSYGYADDSNCLISSGTSDPKPILQLIDEPGPVSLPHFSRPTTFPPKPKFDPWMDNLRKLKGEKTDMDKWIEACDNIEKAAKKQWELTCRQLQMQHDKLLTETRKRNEGIKKEYEEHLKAWQQASVTHKLLFRYFKLHALTNTGDWPIRLFDSKEIAVWYIGYLLMTLRERYGDDIIIQFGVPCGASNTRRDRIIIRKAYEIYISAADLINNFNSVDDYLSATYEELRSMTVYKNITEDIINQYYFDDIPEAFAGLVAVTLQKKLGLGFHLLVDIGGGTTDLALFCVSEDLSPDVLYVTSFTHGINGILEESQKMTNKSLEILQKEFLTQRSIRYFSNPIKNYKKTLTREGQDVVHVIEHSFLDSYYHHGRSLNELRDALKNQPIIFGGGGGSFRELHTHVQNFTDIRKIDRTMLSIRNLINQGIDDKQFTILATSYGLASYEKPYEGGIQCTDILDAFHKFLPARNTNSMSNDKYEHGLSDT